MEQTKTLGQKIRFYRQRAGLTQMELELELGASIGSVSRIEKDKINPTKETLHTLAHFLKLTKAELADLLGVQNLSPTEEEIKGALKEIEEHFKNPKVLAYLLDEHSIFHTASESMLRFMGLTLQDLPIYVGRSLFEIMTYPEFKVKEKLHSKSYLKTLTTELARYRIDAGFNEHTSFIRDLMYFSDEFKTAWQNSKSLSLSETYDPENKIVYFNVGTGKVRMNFSRENLKTQPRFEVIEYFNPVLYE